MHPSPDQPLRPLETLPANQRTRKTPPLPGFAGHPPPPPPPASDLHRGAGPLPRSCDARPGLESHDDRRPLRSLAAVFVYQPPQYLKFPGVRLEGCFKRFRGLPDQPLGGRRSAAARPSWEQRQPEPRTGATPAAPTPPPKRSATSSKKPNAPPSGSAAPPTARSGPLRWTGRPNRGLLPDPHSPEIRRGAFLRSAGGLAMSGRPLPPPPRI